MQPEVLEALLHSVLDRLSNGEDVKIEEEWIEEAGEQFKAALRKQVTPRDQTFRVRMSNIGRPLCQLQMGKADTPKSRMPYNHIVRMMIGDASEVIARLIMKAADVNVTSDGDRVTLDVDGHIIKGDSDIDIDGAVWDVKSASQWAFENKWLKGYSSLRESDGFGYIGQLFGYADAQDKPAGGWIVLDKSNGYVAVIPQEADVAEVAAIRNERGNVVRAINEDWPFERCFEAVVDTFRREPTGAKKLGVECGFCDFKETCWPTAKKMTSPATKAKNPTYHWYVEHPDMEVSDGSKG
jgi:hypothetical protein